MTMAELFACLALSCSCPSFTSGMISRYAGECSLYVRKGCQIHVGMGMSWAEVLASGAAGRQRWGLLAEAAACKVCISQAQASCLAAERKFTHLFMLEVL